MNAVRRGLIACAAFASAPALAADDFPLTDLKWLAVDVDRVEHLTTFVPEPVSDNVVGTFAFELGRLAFRSPGLLGGVAAREGLRCQTCHMNGRSNPNFFLAGLSSDPGTVDTTTSVFSEVLGDGTLNPIEIPTLVAVTETGPYGHDGREASLEAFTRTVIVDEFAGREPDPAIFDAVVTYIGALEEKEAPAREPLTLFHEFLDLERALTVLETALQKNEPATASFIVFAMRSHLGRINERFAGSPFEDARQRIASWSDDLRHLRDAVESGNFSEARQGAQEWRKNFRGQRHELTSAEDRSLYNQNELQTALDATKD